MAAAPAPPAGSAWEVARDELRGEFGDAAFELRFSLNGDAAVRVLGRGSDVAARHAEAPDPRAPWSAAATWAGAAGWLLAARAPADSAHATDVLQRAVERHSAEAMRRLATQRGALVAELLETLTHRLRTDVSTLQAVAEGALAGLFEGEELVQIPAELTGMGAEAQRRLSLVREVMTVLQPDAPRRPEAIVEVLEAELDAAGVATRVEAVAGELPMALVPGAGWAASARLLAAALAGDERLGGAVVRVRPDPDGWTVTAGPAGAGGGEPLPWSERTVGELVHAGEIAAAAGGRASAARTTGELLLIELTLPAAPSG
jgi:signal transduction histidine kinase